MKLLKIQRGVSLFPLTCVNGDRYDSTAELGEGNQSPMWSSMQVNTDPTVGYKGGRLSAGSYYGIKMQRPDGRWCIFIFSKACDITKIKAFTDIDPKYYDLPSDVPNPNHAGKPIISLVLVHGGGTTWDYSHGCVTVLSTSDHPNQFDKLMDCLVENEIIDIILVAA